MSTRYGRPVDPLIASASRVPGRHVGARVTLSALTLLPGGTTSTVLRMKVRGGAGLPASVVVKAAAPGFDRLLFNDWPATELLTRLGGQPARGGGRPGSGRGHGVAGVLRPPARPTARGCARPCR